MAPPGIRNGEKWSGILMEKLTRWRGNRQTRYRRDGRRMGKASRRHRPPGSPSVLSRQPAKKNRNNTSLYDTHAI